MSWGYRKEVCFPPEGRGYGGYQSHKWDKSNTCKRCSLTREVKPRYKLQEEKIIELQAENARYRKALENIATLGSIFDENASAQVAREALRADIPPEKGGE